MSVKDQQTRTDTLIGFASDSLVGSYFHSFENDETDGKPYVEWQGQVVAEVEPGVYLIELMSWLGGNSTHQQLCKLEDMTGWRFYDQTEWMNGEYRDRWEQRAQERADRE